MEQSNQFIDEYRFKVTTLCGFSELVFKRDGTIVLVESSPITKTEDLIEMNEYENLREFLTRNLRPLCRDELVFKMTQRIDIDPKTIKVPHNLYEN